MEKIKTKSREVEHAARKKIFKLQYQWFLEAKPARLIVSCFPVGKVMVDGIVTDIRVVWDWKANEHNAILW